MGENDNGEYRPISFYVNEELVNIETDLDNFIKLRESDNYAVQYIEMLVDNNFVKPNGPIQSVKRLCDDGSENEIYQCQRSESAEVPSCSNKSETTADADCTDGSAVRVKTPKSDAEWDTPETKFLLDKYEQYLPMIGPMKKFKTKKKMWVKISQDIKEILNISKTDTQCENRYKTIMKRKKKSEKNNHRTGEVRQDIEYEADLQKIASIDDSIEPEQLRGVGMSVTKESVSEGLYSEEDSGSSSSSIPVDKSAKKRKLEVSSNKSRKKTKSLSDTLLLIHERKEENRERRHKEKMNMMEQLIQLLKDK